MKKLPKKNRKTAKERIQWVFSFHGHPTAQEGQRREDNTNKREQSGCNQRDVRRFGDAFSGPKFLEQLMSLVEKAFQVGQEGLLSERLH
jgi:hypothetical protein